MRENKESDQILAKDCVCEQCDEAIRRIVKPDKKLSLYDQVEFVKNFCYLGDRLNASAGSEAALTART